MVQANPGTLSHAAGWPAADNPGDEALLGGVAPVFRADAPAGGHVVRERDIACGVDVQRRGVHVFVDDDAAVVGVEASIDGQVGVGADPGGRDDDVGVERGAGVEVDMGVVDVSDGRRPQEANPIVGQDLCDALANLVAESALQLRGLGGDHSGGHAAAGETGGRLTTDQSAADHDGGVGAAGGHSQDDGVGEGAQGSAASAPGMLSGTGKAPQASTRCQKG
jgi:hypothetical protein